MSSTPDHGTPDHGTPDHGTPKNDSAPHVDGHCPRGQWDSLSDFKTQVFEWQGQSKRVYTKGQGPAVLVMTEIPGITPMVANFARRLVHEGFSVAMPDLIGVAGKPRSSLYVVTSLAKACISREFSVFASNQSSPITDWLRALCRDLHKTIGGRGVGAIGMCLTGNFALSLMVEPCMMAPVLSQPSLPVGLSANMRAALHISDSDLEQAVKRSHEADVPVLGLRFTKDFNVPCARFQSLKKAFGDKFRGLDIDSSCGNEHNIPRTAHSVVTEHLVDTDGHPTQDALHEVISFFKKQLQPQ